MGRPVIPPSTLQPQAAVVGIGAATLDDLWLVQSFHDGECVAQAQQHVQMGGGPVATALCVLGCLGHPTTLLDTLGDDQTATSIKHGLLECGVSVDGLREVQDVRSASAVILVRQHDGARQIHFSPSGAGELRLDDAQLQLVRGARLLHINGRHEQAARQAVAEAKAAGVTVSFDGGAGRYRDSIRDLVLQSEIRIFSLEFARSLCQSSDLDTIIQFLLEPPAQILVLTDGVRGSHVAMPDVLRLHQPAFPAEPLVDTTGCGDVYHGAFLHGWLQGWSVQRSAAFASRLGAVNAQGLGGRWACHALRAKADFLLDG